MNIDSLPTAAGALPSAPDPDAMSNALAVASRPERRCERASRRDDRGRPCAASKDLGRDPAEVENPYKIKALATPDQAPASAPSAPLLPSDRSPLNRGAALAALGSAASAAAACKRADGPSGSGSASVTFSPEGPVKSVSVSPPFAGTAVGQCVIGAFRGAHVPPFSGSSITLPKSFQIPQ
ncbi:MAG: hypothetical protein WDO74_00250 [Pseudomonadota bacterium]